MKYYVLDENGEDRQTTRKIFAYYLEHFGHTFMDNIGKLYNRNEIELSSVMNVFNPNGVQIAWKEESND